MIVLVQQWHRVLEPDAKRFDDITDTIRVGRRRHTTDNALLFLDRLDGQDRIHPVHGLAPVSRGPSSGSWRIF
ncbi:hypothetical protein D3C71_1027820 [compost metagenome]